MNWSIPVKTDHMKHEFKHKPSMQYAKDIYRVASTLDKPLALEIGAAWGFSTLAILEAGAKHLTSVDNNIMAQGENEARANGYTNYAWDCTRSDKFWSTNKTSFDLIYVDGSHIYDDVVNDLYEAWHFLNDGGLMLVDDWDHKKNIEVYDCKLEYGVSLACWEFWRDHIEEVKEVGIEGRVLWFSK